MAVFVDWQNLYKGARDAFHDDRAPSRLGMVDPVRLGQRLIQLSHGRDRELVDVVLAVDFVVMAVTRTYDVGILVSTDTDLVPALEAVVGLGGNRGPRAEVAAWTSSRGAPRLRVSQVRLWCHYLRVDDYRGMVDPTDYTIP